MLAMALLLQAAGPALAAPIVQKCVPRDDEEIVVCGRRGDSPHRLKPLPPPPDDARRDPLAVRLPGGGEGRVYVFERRIADVPSRGIAAKAVFPLGGSKKDAGSER